MLQSIVQVKHENNPHWEKFLLFFNKIPIIDPTNPLLQIWDAFHLSAIGFCTFYIPIEWVSQVDFSTIYGARWYIVLVFCLLVFLANMVLQTVTGYYSQGMKILNKETVRKNYFSNRLLLDLSTIMPLLLRIMSF